MKTFRLNTTASFVDPAWFTSVRHGTLDAVVAENGRVLLKGQELSIRDDAIEPGEKVKVWLDRSGFFAAARAADIEHQEAVVASEAAARAEAARLKLNAKRDAANAANGKLKLPVAWAVGIKDVLSGLSETSWGDGRSNATVEHVYLLDDLSVGRLQRRKGDLLCTAKNGTNGMRYSTVDQSQIDGDGKAFTPPVTCKKCLTLAMRFTNGLPLDVPASDESPSP